MGAGASTAEVSQHLQSLGQAYSIYAQAAVDNGLDGDLLASCDDSELNETLDVLGVTTNLHRKRLMNEIKKAAGDISTAPVAAVPSAAAANATIVRRQRSSFSQGSVKISLSWNGNIDLDLNAVTFKDGGHTLDFVYYANTETRDRSISHSGDSKGGDMTNNEEISIKPNLLHPQAAAVVVFVRCHEVGVNLRNATNVIVTITSR